MELNNLSDRERMVADLVWTAQSVDDLQHLIKCMPREDQVRAVAIAALLAMGGDHVESLSDAREVLRQFQL